MWRSEIINQIKLLTIIQKEKWIRGRSRVTRFTTFLEKKPVINSTKTIKQGMKNPLKMARQQSDLESSRVEKAPLCEVTGPVYCANQWTKNEQSQAVARRYKTRRCAMIKVPWFLADWKNQLPFGIYRYVWNTSKELSRTASRLANLDDRAESYLD